MAGTIDMNLQSDIMTMFENNFDYNSVFWLTINLNGL